MAVFLFLLILAAITGVLGAVLKAVALVILAVTVGIVVAGWLGWRAIRRSIESPAGTGAIGGGTTTITIGRARRDDAPSGDLPRSSGRDDRY